MIACQQSNVFAVRFLTFYGKHNTIVLHIKKENKYVYN